MMTTRLVRLLAALPIGLFSAACLDCSQAGCAAQLEIELEADRDEALSLEVCRDGVCYGPIALPPEETQVQLAWDDTLYLVAHAGEGSDLTISATEFDDDMSVTEPPAEVPWTVRLSTGSQMLVDATVTPDYARAFPNGEACGPACYTARHTL